MVGLVVGGQDHWQPLQRAGTAAGRKTRLRAWQAHGMRVVNAEPVHDDCLCGVATTDAAVQEVDLRGVGLGHIVVAQPQLLSAAV